MKTMIIITEKVKAGKTCQVLQTLSALEGSEKSKAPQGIPACRLAGKDRFIQVIFKN